MLSSRASHGGFTEIVKLLLDYGADGRPNGDSEISPLYAACYLGHLPVVKVLAERLPIYLTLPTKVDNSSPLHAASMRGHVHVVRHLIQNHRKSVDEIEADEIKNNGGRQERAGSDPEGGKIEKRKPSKRDKESKHLPVKFITLYSLSVTIAGFRVLQFQTRPSEVVRPWPHLNFSHSIQNNHILV